MFISQIGVVYADDTTRGDAPEGSYKPSDSEGKVGSGASVFQGEEGINYELGGLSELKTKNGDTLKVDRYSVPNGQPIGVYWEDPENRSGKRISVVEPQVNPVDMINGDGDEIKNGGEVEPNDLILVRGNPNYLRAEDVQIDIKGPEGGLKLQKALVGGADLSKLTSAQKQVIRNSKGWSGVTSDLKSIQQGIGNTDLNHGDEPIWAVDFEGEDPGQYSITIEGIDDFEVDNNPVDSATTTKTVNVVKPNSEPTASLSVSPSNPTVDEKVTLDASKSSDPDGSITSYKWDFGNDGKTDERGEQVKHTFTKSGYHTVSLTVQDNDGATNTVKKQIEVEEKTNQKPNAEFTVFPSKPKVGEQVKLNGGPSSDPDGSITSYKWDFGNDGFTDEEGETVKHTFRKSGYHTVSLEVQDNDGDTNKAEKQINVKEKPKEETDNQDQKEKQPNQKPTAEFTISPSNPVEGDNLRLDASGSTDTDGSIQQYSWSISGESYRGKQVSYTAENSGTYLVKLTVKDDKGDTDSKTKNIRVRSKKSEESSNDKPRPEIDYTPNSPNAKQDILFDGSGSRDPDGSIESYRWSVGGSRSKTGKTVSYSFTDPGNYQVILTVEDNQGETSTETQTIQVSPQPAKFKYSQLQIHKKNPKTSETVTISANVKNIGGKQGSYRASLISNGKTLKTKTGTLSSGRSTQIKFQRQFINTGSYKLTVNNLPPKTVQVKIRRGFFTNNPESPIGLLDNEFNLTFVGFALSIIGILIPLFRGR